MTRFEDSRVRYALLGAALLIIFAFLTIEVIAPQSFIRTADMWSEQQLLALRTDFFLRVFEGLTLLGNIVTVSYLAGFVGIFFAYTKSLRPYFFGFASTLLGAGISGYLLKLIVGRARPGGLIPSTIETSFSFPSGHAIAAVALYGFIAFFFCKRYPQHARLAAVVAAVLMLMIGFSRLYLGVHFPSDVIAGYTVGGLWLLAGIVITERLQRPRG